MIKYTLISIISFISIVLVAQTDETPGLYTWKGKKTIAEKGYVVLKSDKKLEGNIILKGSQSNITGLHYSGDGKEIDFPLTALKAYGLTVGGSSSNPNEKVNSGSAICDNNVNLFIWRDMGEVMGKKIETTKPRNGYIIKRNGERVEGSLQIKKSDGKIVEFKLKTEKGKEKLDFNQVSNYGLLMTIDELTKSGEKKFNDEARNFYTGTVFLNDGSEKNGLIAFQKKTLINPNKPGLGDKYQGLLYAANKDAIIKTYKDSEIKSVIHNDLSYSPYQGGFIAENAMDNAKFSNKFKLFNEGVLTLSDGKKRTGEVAYVNQESANFKSKDGLITLYQSKEVKRFDVKVEGEQKAMINIDGKLTEEFYRGTTFLAYDNPTSTTINEKKTNTARSLVGMSTSLTSAIVISEDEKKNGYETNLDSLVMSSSTKELKEYRDAIVALNGYTTSQELQDKSDNQTAKKYDAALNLAIAGKESQDKIVVYYDEIILKNIKTNETYLLYKDKKDLNGKLEGLLMGCYTFLSLDKKEQKQYYDIDNIVKTTKMLDECY